MSTIYEKTTFTSIVNEILLKKDESWLAFIFKEQKITIGDLKHNVDYFIMNLQKMGIAKGDVIGYSFPNCPETVYLLLALAKMGVCALPLFHMIPPAVRISIFEKSRVKYVICNSAQYTILKEAALQSKTSLRIISTDYSPDIDLTFSEDNSEAVIDESDLDNISEELPFLMASSSGTTGIPKSALFTQGNAAASLKAAYYFAERKDSTGQENYTCVLAFPFSSSGITVSLGMMTAGVTLIFSDDMSPVTYLQLIQQYKSFSMAAPPSYFEGILKLPMLDKFDLSSIKNVMSGMDFFSNKLLNRLCEHFPYISSAGNGYGLVETTNIFMVWKANSRQELVSPTNTLTLVQNIGNEIEVFNSNNITCLAGEDGELRMKGSSNINGYPGNPDESEKAYYNGWFKTGDYVKKISEDKIAILGRRKYVIKRGGRSISPLLIKQVIEKIPKINNAAVVGVPQELYGEMIFAFITRDPGKEVSEGFIMRKCREHLASYMVPDYIIFIDEIPKNPGVGKVNFELLKEKAIEQLQKSGVMND